MTMRIPVFPGARWLARLVLVLVLLDARGVYSLAPERSRGSYDVSTKSSGGQPQRRHQQQQRRRQSQSASGVSSQSSPLFARQWHLYQEDDDGDRRSSSNDDGASMQKSTSSRRSVSYERPTLTMTQRPDNPIIPDKPKIIVLGASGKIGRLVVRQLLEQEHLDMTVVACCRDYDKACRVLYDDLLVAVSNNRNRRGGGGGPKLQIVQADLVPLEDLPGKFAHDNKAYDDDDDDEVDEEEAEWLRRAQSASKFYRNSVKDYDDRDHDGRTTPGTENPHNSVVDSNEALEEAIRGCTAIISCVGAVRPTNLWTDILARPLVRLLRPDVSGWCRDARHPYYVHFCSTRKVLAYAEREQLRREAAAAAERDEEIETQQHQGNYHKHGHKNKGLLQSQVPRIRFIRISDLCVSQPPWAFIPWLTNLLHSMVFRYQDMAEQIVQSSSVLETIVLRPGDLVDDTRDENTTSLQVSVDGKVPAPSRVGRDDVAALAVAATLFDSSVLMQDDNTGSSTYAVEEPQAPAPPPPPPFHYTLAVRWAGQQLDPYPAQGTKSQGYPNAFLGLQSALGTIRKRDKFKQRQKGLLQEKEKASSGDSSVVRFARQLPSVRRKLKPYGVFVAIPVYFALVMMTRTLIQTTLQILLPSLASSPPSFALSAKLKAFITRILMAPSLLVTSLPLRRAAAQKYISF